MIFYFSATGNSRYVAQRIAKRTGDTAIDIQTAIVENAYDYQLADNERLGFVVPVYFGDIPKTVKDFIRDVEIRTGDGYYAYCVMTCGAFTAAASYQIKKALMARGLTLNAKFSVLMVDTFAPLFEIPNASNARELENKSRTVIGLIAEQVADKNCGNYDTHPGKFPNITGLFMSPFYKIMQKSIRFNVADNCIGCGLCAKNCPDHAILMHDAKPKWKNSCMLCMACFHHCPVRAIDFGQMTKKRIQYKGIPSDAKAD